MSPPLVRCVHRGSVEAVALVVEARERVLALWRPGTRVERTPSGWLVRLSEPRRLRADAAAGTPLVAHAGMLLAAPLTRAELERAGAVGGALVLVQGGAAGVVSGEPVDPAEWLDLGGFTVVEVRGLGQPPPPVVIAAPPPRPAHEMFSVAPPSPQATAVARAVMAAAAARAAAPARVARDAPPAADVAFAVRFGLGAMAVTAALAVVLFAPALLLPLLVALLAGRGVLATAPSPRPTRSAAPPPPPRAPSALWRWLSRLLARSPLGRDLERRHARYLEELLGLLDAGDVDAALRRALPLGGAGGGAPAWSLPSPRQDIRVSPVAPSGPGSSIFADDPVLGALRERYWALHQRLEAQGRIDEAAFVLGELLGEWAAAVSLLERHGRHRLAAEVAEGRQLDPALVVHLWMKAGDAARAVRNARLRQCFAAAIERAEATKDPEQARLARELRWLWAESLADGGDLAGAVAAVESAFHQLSGEARARVRGWLDDAVAAGGTPGARLLARGLALVEGDERAAWRARAIAAARGEHALTAGERTAFLKNLLAVKNDAARVVARPAVRALLPLAAAGDGPAGKLALELARHAQDPVLVADLPPLPRPADAAEGARTDQLAADDRGQVPAWDAAWLADGRIAIALGEAGIRLVERKRVRLIAEPAESLVVAQAGARALALAPRGPFTRVARLDLAAGTGVPWADLPLERWARSPRLGCWAVATVRPGSRPAAVVQLLDLERDTPAALFHVDRIGEGVHALAHDDGGLAFTSGDAFEPPTLWRYDAGLVLRDRAPWRTAADFVLGGFAISSAGSFAWLRWVTDDAKASRLSIASGPSAPVTEVRIGRFGNLGDLIFDEPFIALALLDDSGALVNVWRAKPVGLVLEISLAGARRVRLRFRPGDDATPPALVVADDLGRVLAYDLVSGARLVDLRT